MGLGGDWYAIPDGYWWWTGSPNYEDRVLRTASGELVSIEDAKAQRKVLQSSKRKVEA